MRDFSDGFNNNIEKIVIRQENDLIELMDVRKKYVRLANRIGYRPDVIKDVFEKERKKTMRKLKKKKYSQKLKIYAEKDC